MKQILGIIILFWSALCFGQSIEEKLDQLVIPKVEFSDTPLEDCFLYLARKSVELDPAENSKGISLVNTAADPNGTKITLRLSNVPLREALRYTCSLASLQFEVKDDAVVITPISSVHRDYHKKAYQVPAQFHSSFKNQPPRDQLEAIGVQFPKGASAIFSEEHSQVIVRVPEDQLTIVEAYLKMLFGESAEPVIPEEVRALSMKLKQIHIPEIKFENIPFSEALESLQRASMKFDSETDLNKKGINLILEGGLPDPEPRITLSLVNVPLDDALKYAASLAGFEIHLEDGIVVVQRPK